MFSLQKITNAFQWSLMRSFVKQFLVPLLRIFIIPIVGPSNYGVVAIVFLYFGFIEIIFPFGIKDFILSRYINDKNHLRMLHTISFFLSIIALILCLILSFFLFLYYDSSEISLAFLITSFLFPLIGLGLVPQTIIEKKLDIKHLFLMSLIPCITSIFVTFPLAILGYGFWSILTGHILNYAISNLIFFYINPISFSIPSRDSILKLFSFGKWNTTEKASEYFIWWIDLFFVSFLGVEISGIYGLGKNFAMLLFTMLTSPIVSIILPIFGAMKKNVEKLSSVFVSVINISMIINIIFGFSASLISYYLFQNFFLNWKDLNIICLYMFISTIFSRSFPLLREKLKVRNHIRSYPILLIILNIIFTISFFILKPLIIIDFLRLKFLNDLIFAFLMTLLLVNIIRNNKHSFQNFISGMKKVIFLFLINFCAVFYIIELFEYKGLNLNMILIFVLIIFYIFFVYKLLRKNITELNNLYLR